jgi:uncharacterized membrane protein
METEIEKGKRLAHDCATKAVETSRKLNQHGWIRLFVAVIELAFGLITLLIGAWFVTIFMIVFAVLECHSAYNAFKASIEAYDEYMKLRDDCLETVREMEDQYDHN